jgi:hypothetical protein
MKTRTKSAGAASKTFLFLLTVIACAGAGWHFYLRGGGTPGDALEDAKGWVSGTVESAKTLSGTEDPNVAVAKEYAKDFSRRPYTLEEAASHRDLWPEKVLVKPQLEKMPHANIRGELTNIEDGKLVVLMEGYTLRVAAEDTDFDEKLRKNIYDAAFAAKMENLAGTVP